MQRTRLAGVVVLLALVGIGGTMVGCGSGAQDPATDGKTTKDITREDYQQKKAAALAKAGGTKASSGKSSKPRANAGP